MAEKKGSVKYKFGQKELDMDLYLKNIGNNVQSYLQDRRKRGWTDDQVQEFSTTYNRYMDAFKQQLSENSNRFSTDDLGSIIDTQGEFTNIDNDDEVGGQFYYNDKGEKITNDDYNMLKDKKKKGYKTFNANRLVAEYFRTIGNAMLTKAAEQTEKFDINKHGFVSWWKQKYNPAGGLVDLKPFLDKDPVGPDGKRPVNVRAKMASEWMNEYLNWLGDKNLDYSNYDQFPDYETYSAKGRELATKWGDGKWDSDDLIAGQAFGVGGNWAEGFFTEKENPDLTPAQQQAQDDAKKAEQVRKNKETWIANQQAIFNNSGSRWIQSNPYGVSYDKNYWYNTDGTLNLDNYYKSWGKNFINPKTDKLDPGLLDSYINEFVQNPFDAKYKLDIARNIIGLIEQGVAQPISGGKLEGMYYIPSKSDEQHNRALVFDPNSRNMFYTFIGDIPQLWKTLTDKWDITNGVASSNAPYMWKEGGVIESMQLGGNFGNTFVENRDAYINSKAALAGMDPKKYEASLREITGKDNALNPNNGFSANDILRLTALGTDLAAMGLSFTPAIGASAITGAAGTTQHFIADAMEDGLDWGDVGRATLGYGMDLLGVIPGVSGVTKAGKIAKTLVRYAPRLIAAVGAAGTVANAPEIIKSVGKLTSDEKMTVHDWQNITQALQIAIGVGAGAGRAYHRNTGNGNYNINPRKVRAAVDNTVGPKVKPNVHPDGRVVVQVRKKGTNDVENLLLTPEESAKALAAKDNKDIMDALVGREGIGDYELATSTSWMPHFRWKTQGDQGHFYFDQKLAKVMPLKTNQVSGDVYARNGNWGKDVADSDFVLRTKGEVAATALRAADDALIDNIVKNDSLFAAARRASAQHERHLSQKDATKARLTTAKTDAEARIAATPGKPTRDRATVQGLLDRLTSNRGTTRLKDTRARMKAAQSEIQALEGNVTSLKGELATLEAQHAAATGVAKRGLKKQIAAKQAEITQAETAVTTRKNQHTDDTNWWKQFGTGRGDKSVKSLQAELAAIDKYEAATQADKQRITKIDDLLAKVNALTDTKGLTPAYLALLGRKKADGTIDFTDGTRTITRNFDEILSRYGIVYRQGGSFTKLRKFLLGGSVRNVQGNADWFRDMYKHKSMTNWLGTWNTENYENFNKLQDSWINNLGQSGYDPNNPAQAKHGQGVAARLAEWNKTGTNAAIKDLTTLGVLKGNGGTNDKAEAYLDGYFGAQEYLRHGGTNDSWFGHEEELTAQKELFKKQGLDYYPDPMTGMYKLRPLQLAQSEPEPTTPQLPATQPQTITLVDPEDNSGNGSGDNGSETPQTRSNTFGGIRNLLGNPDFMSIGRTAYANKVNDIMTERSIKAARESLTLYDLKDDTKYLKGDLDAMMAGQLAAGQMYHIASLPMTSDASLLLASYLDAAGKAETYITQGRAANNQALRKSAEELWQLRKANADFNYDVAMKNRASIGDLIDNIANLENARDAKRYANNDTLLQELQYKQKQKAAKRDALEERFAMSDIHNNVFSDPTSFGVQLSDAEQTVWQKVYSGAVQPSQLSTSEYRTYMQAYRKVAEAELNEMRRYYGISTNNFSNVRNLSAETSSWTPMINAKDGAKIAVAKIRERTKDADRFQKTIKDKHDRVDKAIARADKKMYPRRDPERRRRK